MVWLSTYREKEVWEEGKKQGIIMINFVELANKMKDGPGVFLRPDEQNIIDQLQDCFTSVFQSTYSRLSHTRKMEIIAKTLLSLVNG